MVTTCAVVGCNSSWNPFTDVSFYRITSNKKILPLWHQVVKINPSENSKICSLHFKEEDFVDSRGEKRLRRLSVPSFNIIDKANNTDDEVDGDDDDDNKNLSMLKQKLRSSKHVDRNDESTIKRPAQDFEMVMPCCNSMEHSNSENVLTSKQTRNTGSQVSTKTDREVSLQSKVKLLNLRLRRRDAKISYMKTVFNMIKKHVKGTDMEYKLCCELENISKIPDTEKSHPRKNASKKQVREESPVSDQNDDEIDDVESSGDEAGAFVEVTLSPNLRVSNGS